MLTDVVTIRFCPTNKNAIPLNADNYLICRLNNLLDTLSVIFQIYCMNVYMAVRYDSWVIPCQITQWLKRYPPRF